MGLRKFDVTLECLFGEKKCTTKVGGKEKESVVKLPGSGDPSTSHFLRVHTKKVRGKTFTESYNARQWWSEGF